MTVDFSSIFGNEALLSMLAGRIRTKTAAHAYLLSGPAGCGKHTLALTLAAALSCEDPNRVPCGKCSACRKILARPVQSPDVYEIGLDGNDTAAKNGRKTNSIGIGEIRAVRDTAYIRPNDLENKIYILGHAERLTVQAQNAVLKILEEPPASVMFFLLCENDAALLPTVRSRVQTLRMERFGDETLKKLLTAHDSEASSLSRRDPDRLALFIRLADGAYGRALFYLHAAPKELQSDPAYDAHAGAVRCLSCLFSDTEDISGGSVLGAASPANRTELAAVLAAQGDTRDRLRGLIDALSAAIRDLTAFSLGCEKTMLFYSDREQPRALSERCSVHDLTRLSQALSALRCQLDSNPNTALVQTALVLALHTLRIHS